jgi:hypothetical protein
MTDRELLEAAAKAAGVAVSFDRARRDWGWNPLDADGDALRLAVKLGLDVNIDAPRESEPYTDVVGFMCNDSAQLVDVNEPHDGDPYAATRRAIVRAAAEIGRQMK